MLADEKGLNEEPTPQEQGGVARAKALAPVERQKIARAAAEARWAIPRATHEGMLKLGAMEIRCAVLEDGTRVLTQADFLEALGRHRKANVRKVEGEEKVPSLLQGEALKPFISQELLEKSQPISFRLAKGVRASGYRADLLPKVCEVYLQARDAGALKAQQSHIAMQADILIRALANVGIIALVDEATGYEEVRDREALQKILDLYLAKEFAAWAKRFPDDFYKEIFKLKGWEWGGMRKNRPPLIGKYTNDLVYDRLAPGILKDLQQRNPKDERGNRKARHHQWLTADVGHPRLAEHLYGLIGLMRAHDAGEWNEFRRAVDKAYPKRGSNLDIFIDSSTAPERPSAR